MLSKTLLLSWPCRNAPLPRSGEGLNGCELEEDFSTSQDVSLMVSALPQKPTALLCKIIL